MEHDGSRLAVASRPFIMTQLCSWYLIPMYEDQLSLSLKFPPDTMRWRDDIYSVSINHSLSCVSITLCPVSVSHSVMLLSDCDMVHKKSINKIFMFCQLFSLQWSTTVIPCLINHQTGSDWFNMKHTEVSMFMVSLHGTSVYKLVATLLLSTNGRPSLQ